LVTISAESSQKLDGALADKEAIQELQEKLPVALAPLWFIALLENYKLAGVNFSLSENDDLSGLGAEMLWLTPKQILSEAFEAEPGALALKLGFLPVGGCALGSGDPYFLDLRKECNDPPLVRVPHEYAGNETYPLDMIELVTQTLSDFFKQASINA
jgi:hypothetical protein